MPASLAVVISTYNAPRMLRLALEGYKAQTDTGFCIYIADDGSGEETQQLIDAFRQHAPVPVQHIRHEDAGFRKARIHNEVIRQCSEDYILLTDGDCIPLPGLVAAHRRFASRGCFVSGSRILLSESLSRRLQDGAVTLPAFTAGRMLQWRTRGEINRLLPLLLPLHISPPHNRLEGIRGCHLACWRQDLLTINGFDETFEGWGREDSDLAARLLHAGIRRRDLRGLPVLHIWHAEEPRDRLAENDAMLAQCLNEKRIRAIRGIAEL
jgi:glycosyltransferase involved in cell wall biosynthesis